MYSQLAIHHPRGSAPGQLRRIGGTALPSGPAVTSFSRQRSHPAVHHLNLPSNFLSTSLTLVAASPPQGAATRHGLMLKWPHGLRRLTLLLWFTPPPPPLLELLLGPSASLPNGALSITT